MRPGIPAIQVASRIDTRYTPRLEFVLDLGVKKSIEMRQILERVLPAKSRGRSPRRATDDSDDRGLPDDDDPTKLIHVDGPEPARMPVGAGPSPHG